MTREEQIVEYANSFKGKGIESDELKEIVRLAIIDGAKWADAHPQEPSLPSNLDEAEFEYAQSLDEMPANQEEEEMIYDAFKAGAEWQKEQDDKLVDIIYQQGIEKGKDEMRETLKKNEK